jgi:poly-gamma-glutamate capsule biosynthesis protein CapA/YwtB (metallophosphatase superfamily)
MIAHNLSILPYSNDVAEIIRKGDVRFTNCECLFHKGDFYPMPRGASAATLWYAEPPLAKELAWFGFNLVSIANTHASDFGPEGLLSTIQVLDDCGITISGGGRDLDEARESKYLDTVNGRVALISACYDSWHTPWERASNAGSGFPPRPGTNLLRVTTEHTIHKEGLRSLSEIKRDAGLEPRSGRRAQEIDAGTLSFLGHSFKEGGNTGTRTTIVQEDLDNLKNSVRDAKELADWVLVSFHSHTSGPAGSEYPSDLVRELAHTSIDCGADAFLGHGPHILRGIEVYKRRPIFYSLGNFIAHNNSVKKVTRDQFDFLNLGYNAKPSDFYNARKGDIPPSEAPYSHWWYESIVGYFELAEDGLSSLEAYPILLGNPDQGSDKADAGNPRVPDERSSESIATSLARLSSDFGTKLEYNRERRVLVLQ